MGESQRAVSIRDPDGCKARRGNNPPGLVLKERAGCASAQNLFAVLLLHKSAVPVYGD